MLNFIEFFVKEFDEFNIVLSLILGEMICYWCLVVNDVVELFLRIFEKDDVNFVSMIFILCSVFIRVKFLEGYVVCILVVVQRKFFKEWIFQVIGKLLQDVEDNGFNIDVIEVFYCMGKEFEDFEVFGQFVCEYFLVIGEKDFFNCRCRIVEC